MESKVCPELEERIDASRGLRLALRRAVANDARLLARSRKEGPSRIAARIWLIETLESCKLVSEWFWRDCVASARETMEMEAK